MRRRSLALAVELAVLAVAAVVEARGGGAGKPLGAKDLLALYEHWFDKPYEHMFDQSTVALTISGRDYGVFQAGIGHYWSKLQARTAKAK